MPSVVRKKKLPPANNLSPLPHPVIALPGRGRFFFMPALGAYEPISSQLDRWPTGKALIQDFPRAYFHLEQKEALHSSAS